MKRRLAFVAGMFNAAEVNGSHYTQIRPETYASWAAQTPDDFRFAVKGHRFVTHYKRLRGCADSIVRLRDQAAGLGNKLAAVLWQLPAHLTAERARLDEFLRDLRRWDGVPHVIEFRHRSWFTAEVERRLADADVASCLSDAPDFPLWEATPTGLVYVRLHGHTRKYASSYARASLRRWADRARQWAGAGRQVHLYFDNDAEGAAIRNGLTLLEELAEVDTEPSGTRNGRARPAPAPGDGAGPTGRSRTAVRPAGDENRRSGTARTRR